MKTITLTLSPRFRQWCRENPDSDMAKGTPEGTKKIVMAMSDDTFEGLLDRMRNEGGSMAEWLISSDDFITDIQISDMTSASG
jgi:hypothetical protein